MSTLPKVRLQMRNLTLRLRSEINYGTGKDVSDETVADAGKPLEIHWNAGSYMDVPVD